jgi:hypothetical protein
MSRNASLWKAMLVAPAIVWAGLLSPAQAEVTEAQEKLALSQSQLAAPATTQAAGEIAPTLKAPFTIADSSLAEDAIAEPASVGDLEAAVAEEAEAPSEGMEQVTSVSQLTDVQPTDWAFQALQSLVERYGCIAGYPDGTYKGNRALTRYEFAAGVNACLDRVNELIAAGTTGLATKEDLATLQKLQEEFAAELATLRGRVDALEARTTELEANQFSTTTKLNGLVWFNVTGAFASGDDFIAETVDPEGQFGRLELRQAGRDALTGDPVRSVINNDPPITASNLGWLSFVSSFTGKDTLVTQFAFGNGESPANTFVSAGAFNTWGTPFLDQTAGIQGLGNDVVIRELFYQFPLTDSIQLAVGPRVNWYRYFDNNRFNFFLVGTSTFNSNGSTLLNTLDRGSGAVAQIKLSRAFQINLGYLGENTEFLPGGSGLFNSSSDPERGLFGGTWTATAELAFTPTDNFGIRFLYNRSRIEARGGQIGGVQGEPLQNGIVDAGPGFSVFDPITGTVSDGGLKGSFANTFNVNFDWLITKGFGIFGRYSFGNVNLEPIDEDVNVQTFQAGLAFPDLGKQGALATFSFLIPFDIVDGEEFFVAGRGDDGTQIDLELSYFYPLTANIAIVPAFYAIINPNNFSDNPTVFVGNVRAQFAF